MKNKTVFVAAILLFSACLNSTKTREAKEIKPLAKEVQYPKMDKGGYEFGFSYKTDSISQILLITINEKEKKLSFKLTSSVDSTKKEIIGVADLFSEGGETLVDDDGQAYFITEYLYNANGCKLRFGVDEDFKVVSIFAQSCENDKLANFKERRILKKF